MSNGMPVPAWAEEAREQMFQAHGNLDYTNAGVKRREFEVVHHFSTHFAEYAIKEGDLLVHLFPRSGSDDKYYPASYDPKKNYIPGRLEEKATVVFPGDMSERIKKAADKVWQGSVAIDLTPELGSYAVQFQDAKNTVNVVGVGKFMDQFCEALDGELEGE